MNADSLLKHFARIGDTPDAVPRLRQLVLELAVRGRLARQDPKDEPAGALLGNRQLQLDPASHPWSLPPGWGWSTLQLIGETLGGGTPSKADPEFWTGTIPWVSPKDMKVELIADAQDHISQSAVERSATKLIPSGSLLMVVRGMILAHSFPVATTAVPVTINQDMKAIVPFRADVLPMLLLATKGLKREILRLVLRSTHGTCKLLTEQLFAVPIPIPPLAEQRRVLAKVDELLALCDQLELAQKGRERRRDRTVAASLQRLNQPTDDAPTFREHVRLHLQNLPRLTTRPEHVKQLRQALRTLAIRGQLVPQDRNDDPVPVLERTPRAKEPDRGASRGEVNAPFGVPTGWRWVCFGDLIVGADAGWSPKTENFARSGRNWGVLKVSAVSWEQFLPNENKQLLPGVEPPTRTQIQDGDFLISRANTSELVAKCVIVDRAPEKLILSDKIVRLNIQPGFSRAFLALVNNHADYARAYYAEEASGASPSMKNVSREVIYALPIPVPPLAEQLRIVAKLAELMSLCDQLERSILHQQSSAQRALETVLEECLCAA
jgi:type I restriction enzyme S subunit